jgi:hypothetical protein
MRFAAPSLRIADVRREPRARCLRSELMILCARIGYNP